MTISELGSVGELIGAIATVATLMYLDAVRAMVHQLRNKGVREYWEASGRNLFAQDFVNEVDIILAK